MKRKTPRPPARKGIVLLGLVGLLALGATTAAWVGLGNGRSSYEPGARMSRLDRAKVAYAERDLALAEELAREELKFLPGNEETSLFLGRVLLERGKLSEARGIFAGILKKDPENFGAMYGLGRIYVGLGQLDLGISHLQRATALGKDEPDLWMTWKDLALARKAKGDPFGALTALQESIELAPDQEDLTQMMTELAVGAKPFDIPDFGQNPTIPGIGRSHAGPPDPAGRVRLPQPPDPSQNFPKPGWRQP